MSRLKQEIVGDTFPFRVSVHDSMDFYGTSLNLDILASYDEEIYPPNGFFLQCYGNLSPQEPNG